MYLEAGRVVTSPTDLSNWAACEWAVLRRFDAMLGRSPRLDPVVDAMLDRTAVLGDEHEHHQHQHSPGELVSEPHSHRHRHEPLEHEHSHVSDAHHRHRHD